MEVKKINGYELKDEKSRNSIESLKTIIKNVKEYGCVGNGTTDDTTNLQNAINDVSNGGILFIPKGTYNIVGSLTIGNNVKIVGEEGSILYHEALSTDERFILVEGENVEFENIVFKNQSYRENIVMGDDTYCGNLINITNSNNVRFNKCKFIDIYSYGVMVRSSKDLYFTECLFKDATYNMLNFYQETEDIYIDKCEFNCVHSTSSVGNAYLISTGCSDYDTQFKFRTRNLNITNSRFLNNPFWEGIDSHGVEGAYIANNIIKNVHLGIMMVKDYRPITPCNHGNIKIVNNTMYGLDSTEGGKYSQECGINFGAHEVHSKNVNGFIVENNFIDGFGFGSILAQNTSHFSICNNVILNSKREGIMLYGCNKGNVDKNTIENIDGTYSSKYVGIVVKSRSSKININDNIIKSSTPLEIGIYGDVDYRGIFNAENNIIEASTNIDGFNLYKGDSSLDVPGYRGSLIKNEFGIPTHYCSNNDDYIRSTSVLRAYANATAGSNIINIPKSTNAQRLMEGEEVIIYGAGVDGANLTTVIESYEGENNFKVKDTIQTTITDKKVYTTQAQWTQI